MKKLVFLLAFGLAYALSLPASAATLAIGAAPYIPPTERPAVASSPSIWPVAWVLAFNGTTPATAIIGGHESGQDGRLLPVCRASFKNDVHVGKLVGKNCNFAYGGKEMQALQYQVLVDNPAALTPFPYPEAWMAAQADHEVLRGNPAAQTKNPKLMRWITAQD